MHRILLVLIVIVFLFATCKKYPENPLICLKPKWMRITGDYVMHKYIVNGTDSTALLSRQAYIPSHNITSGFEYTYSFVKDDYKDFFGPFSSADWGWIDKKKSLLISSYSTRDVEYYEILPEGEYRILRLTNKELWLSDFRTGMYREIHLKKLRE